MSKKADGFSDFVLEVVPRQLRVLVLYCRPFSDLCVQLSTTGIFCQKIGKCCTIKYYVRKIQNPGFWVNTKYNFKDPPAKAAPLRN